VNSSHGRDNIPGIINRNRLVTSSRDAIARHLSIAGGCGVAAIKAMRSLRRILQEGPSHFSGTRATLPPLIHYPPVVAAAAAAVTAAFYSECNL
jgi:hypothetical protein